MLGRVKPIVVLTIQVGGVGFFGSLASLRRSSAKERGDEDLTADWRRPGRRRAAKPDRTPEHQLADGNTAFFDLTVRFVSSSRAARPRLTLDRWAPAIPPTD